LSHSRLHTALTARQIEVPTLVVAGESNKAIARELQVEVGTVKSRMTANMARLGATARTQAAGIQWHGL
jgi:DNA-binding NarL/FixJ family response regulator